MDKTDWRIEGLDLRLDRDLRVGALRYLDAAALGSLAEALPGAVLPRPRQVLAIAPGTAAEIMLAWRSPTEVLVLSAGAAPFEALAAALRAATHACFVDQTGGFWALRAAGPRAQDLLVRLGGAAAIPQPGEALIGRFADLSVVAVCLRAQQYLLLVERVYAEHLLAWTSATIGDL